MRVRGRWKRLLALALALETCLGGGGCLYPYNKHITPPCHGKLPRELDKVTQPVHVLEPNDLINVNAEVIIPKPPYRIEALDILLVQVSGTLANEPINGYYEIDPDGTLDLGLSYGKIMVERMTLARAKQAIESHLKKLLANPRVEQLSLAQSRGRQQVAGEHLVRADGTVFLGSYGDVFVAGLTLDEARKAITDQLSKELLDPEITLEVTGYNSKYFYLITDSGGAGDQVVRIPITGNETVLDALSQLGGVSPISSKFRIWIARPAPPAAGGKQQILPVDLNAITLRAKTATNYQLMPGDRLYVHSEPIVTFTATIARFFGPIEQVFGFTLFAQSLYFTLRPIRTPAPLGPLGTPDLTPITPTLPGPGSFTGPF